MVLECVCGYVSLLSEEATAWEKSTYLTCNKKSKRASLPHSEWWTPTQGADLRSASLPQWTCSSFWYWTQLRGTEFWSLSLSARCWISGSHHTTGLGVPRMYRYGKISLWKVLSTAGRLLLSPSTLSRWKANTSNQSSVRLIREQCPCWQRSLWVSGCLRPGPCWVDGGCDGEIQLYNAFHSISIVSDHEYLVEMAFDNVYVYKTIQ